MNPYYGNNNPPGYPSAPMYPQPGFPQQPAYPPVPGFGQQPPMMQPQQRFVLKSRLNGKVLDAEGPAQNGSRIIMYSQKSGDNANQLWHFEPAGNGWSWIVSAVNPNLVIDVKNGGGEGGQLCLWERKFPPANNQMFQQRGEHIFSAQGPPLVMDIENGNTNDCAQVILWSQKGGFNPNQLWIAEYQNTGAAAAASVQMHHQSMTQPAGFDMHRQIQRDIRQQQREIRQDIREQQRQIRQEIRQNRQEIHHQMRHGGAGNMHHSGRRCLIKSKLNGKVLDAEGGTECGRRIIMYEKKKPLADNQLWRFEPCGNGWNWIVSVGNPNLVFDVKNGGQAGGEICLWNRKVPAEPNQMFDLRGHHIHSAQGNDLVLDIEGANRDDCARVLLWNKKNFDNDNQRWAVKEK